MFDILTLHGIFIAYIYKTKVFVPCIPYVLKYNNIVGSWNIKVRNSLSVFSGVLLSNRIETVLSAKLQSH